MKPQNDLALKGAAVEEWVDLHFFRPLGIRIARALEPTGVSADQVTVWCILIGLVAGHLFVYRDPWLNALGFLLFVLSDIFDSADGQLARLRGTSTRFGRTLDGIGDNVRFVNLYVHLAIRLGLATGHWRGALLLAAAAGLSHSIQSMVVDFVRSAYLALGEGAAAVDLPEDLSAASSGSLIERFAARVYGDYTRRQAQLLPRTAELLRQLRRGGASPAFRAAYRERQQPLLPVCTWMGQNIRFAILGLAAVASRPSAFLWTEALAMNLVLFVLLIPIHESNATALATSLEHPAGAY